MQTINNEKVLLIFRFFHYIWLITINCSKIIVKICFILILKEKMTRF